MSPVVALCKKMKSLKETTQLKLLLFFGSAGCATNLKALLCGWTCSPNQATFANFTFGGISTLGVYVNQSFYDPLYESCKNICIASSLVSSVYTTSASFLSILNSENDPYFVPGSLNPITTYYAGHYSTGVGFSHAAVAPSGNDTAGCAVVLQCPLAQMEFSSPQDLTFCTEYASDSCCTPAQDTLVQTNFQQQVVPFYGSGGCAANVKKVLCGFTCSPRQSEFALFHYGNPSVMNIYVNSSFTDGMLIACRNVCLPLGGGVLVGTEFPTGTNLIQSLNSANDPSYKPSSTTPIIYYHVAPNPNTGGEFVDTVTPPTAADEVGCGPATPPSNSNANMVIISLFLVLIALFIAY